MVPCPRHTSTREYIPGKWSSQFNHNTCSCERHVPKMTGTARRSRSSSTRELDSAENEFKRLVSSAQLTDTTSSSTQSSHDVCHRSRSRQHQSLSSPPRYEDCERNQLFPSGSSSQLLASPGPSSHRDNHGESWQRRPPFASHSVQSNPSSTHPPSPPPFYDSDRSSVDFMPFTPDDINTRGSPMYDDINALQIINNNQCLMMATMIDLVTSTQALASAFNFSSPTPSLSSNRRSLSGDPFAAHDDPGASPKSTKTTPFTTESSNLYRSLPSSPHRRSLSPRATCTSPHFTSSSTHITSPQPPPSHTPFSTSHPTPRMRSLTSYERAVASPSAQYNSSCHEHTLSHVVLSPPHPSVSCPKLIAADMCSGIARFSECPSPRSTDPRSSSPVRNAEDAQPPKDAQAPPVDVLIPLASLTIPECETSGSPQTRHAEHNEACSSTAVDYLSHSPSLGLIADSSDGLTSTSPALTSSASPKLISLPPRETTAAFAPLDGNLVPTSLSEVTSSSVELTHNSWIEASRYRQTPSTSSPLLTKAADSPHTTSPSQPTPPQASALPSTCNTRDVNSLPPVQTHEEVKPSTAPAPPIITCISPILTSTPPRASPLPHFPGSTSSSPTSTLLPLSSPTLSTVTTITNDVPATSHTDTSTSVRPADSEANPSDSAVSPASTSMIQAFASPSTTKPRTPPEPYSPTPHKEEDIDRVGVSPALNSKGSAPSQPPSLNPNSIPDSEVTSPPICPADSLMPPTSIAACEMQSSSQTTVHSSSNETNHAPFDNSGLESSPLEPTSSLRLSIASPSFNSSSLPRSFTTSPTSPPPSPTTGSTTTFPLANTKSFLPTLSTTPLLTSTSTGSLASAALALTSTSSLLTPTSRTHDFTLPLAVADAAGPPATHGSDLASTSHDEVSVDSSDNTMPLTSSTLAPVCEKESSPKIKSSAIIPRSTDVAMAQTRDFTGTPPHVDFTAASPYNTSVSQSPKFTAGSSHPSPSPLQLTSTPPHITSPSPLIKSKSPCIVSSNEPSHALASLPSLFSPLPSLTNTSASTPSALTQANELSALMNFTSTSPALASSSSHLTSSQLDLTLSSYHLSPHLISSRPPQPPQPVGSLPPRSFPVPPLASLTSLTTYTDITPTSSLFGHANDLVPPPHHGHSRIPVDHARTHLVNSELPHLPALLPGTEFPDPASPRLTPSPSATSKRKRQSLNTPPQSDTDIPLSSGGSMPSNQHSGAKAIGGAKLRRNEAAKEPLALSAHHSVLSNLADPNEPTSLACDVLAFKKRLASNVDLVSLGNSVIMNNKRAPRSGVNKKQRSPPAALAVDGQVKRSKRGRPRKSDNTSDLSLTNDPQENEITVGSVNNGPQTHSPGGSDRFVPPNGSNNPDHLIDAELLAALEESLKDGQGSELGAIDEKSTELKNSGPNDVPDETLLLDIDAVQPSLVARYEPQCKGSEPSDSDKGENQVSQFSEASQQRQVNAVCHLSKIDQQPTAPEQEREEGEEEVEVISLVSPLTQPSLPLPCLDTLNGPGAPAEWRLNQEDQQRDAPPFQTPIAGSISIPSLNPTTEEEEEEEGELPPQITATRTPAMSPEKRMKKSTPKSTDRSPTGFGDERDPRERIPFFPLECDWKDANSVPLGGVREVFSEIGRCKAYQREGRGNFQMASGDSSGGGSSAKRAGGGGEGGGRGGRGGKATGGGKAAKKRAEKEKAAKGEAVLAGAGGRRGWCGDAMSMNSMFELREAPETPIASGGEVGIGADGLLNSIASSVMQQCGVPVPVANMMSTLTEVRSGRQRSQKGQQKRSEYMRNRDIANLNQVQRPFIEHPSHHNSGYNPSRPFSVQPSDSSVSMNPLPTGTTQHPAPDYAHRPPALQPNQPRPHPNSLCTNPHSNRPPSNPHRNPYNNPNAHPHPRPRSHHPSIQPHPSPPTRGVPHPGSLYPTSTPGMLYTTPDPTPHCTQAVAQPSNPLYTPQHHNQSTQLPSSTPTAGSGRRSMFQALSQPLGD
eukprot:GHVN01034465.1.p1 GENE.GHVN01034465.1~~GHVN01034465.1.p1  ORF type:complete len:1992 (-),score=341.73 GHVN01034465.1:3344-9319(-)